MNGTCPTCTTETTFDRVGTSPHIETGEPVPQVECGHCNAVLDHGEVA